MGPELRQNLTKNLLTMVEELNITVGFLAELKTEGIIMDEHKSIIQTKSTKYEQVDALVDILGRRHDGVYAKFCNVLRKYNPDLADLLTNTEQKKPAGGDDNPNRSVPTSGGGSSSKVFTNAQLKKCVKKLFAFFANSFDPKDGDVLNHLFGDDVITLAQKEEIDKIQGKKQRSEYLVSRLLETGNETAIIQFLDILNREAAYKFIPEKVYALARNEFP